MGLMVILFDQMLPLCLCPPAEELDSAALPQEPNAGECGLSRSLFLGFDVLADPQGLIVLGEEIEDAPFGNVADHGPKSCTL